VSIGGDKVDYLIGRDSVAESITDRVSGYYTLNEILKTTFEVDEEIQNCDLEG
jgi:hypothetical protein